MPAVAALPEGGQKIGRYQLIRRLAVGGMAEIYLARLPGVGIEGFEKLVVLKRILPQHALDPELLRMFLDEARLSATLTHPHVTEVYDVGTDGEAPFFAMEYVHGANLREIQRAHARRARAAPGGVATGAPAAGVTAGATTATGKTGPGAVARSSSGPHATLATGAAATPTAAAPTGAPRSLSGPQATLGAIPLPLPRAIEIVSAAAAGLHYAHDRLGPGGEPLGIVHRDVSPSNVLVSYDGAVKVSDFGIAKWAFQRTRTQEGTLKGKFAYMSPEQCRGRPVDRRSDIFALGAILYEMTSGLAPFPGPTDLEILNQIATGRAAPPVWGEGTEPYPAELSEIVMRALAPEPADRFPTMQALQLALESFARSSGLDLSTVALAQFLQDLFADELAAWHEAQRAGKSLGEHLAARPAGASTSDPEERTATDAFGAKRRGAAARAGRVRRTMATAAFIGLSAVAGGLVARRWKADPEPARTGPPTAVARASQPQAAGTATPPPQPHPVALADPTTAPRPAISPPLAKAPARSRTRPRAAAPQAVTRPTLDARLGAWDPDSPVPP